jgi:hypothetical protein
MCDFLSGVTLPNGDVLTHPMLDSHADLCTYYHIHDTLPDRLVKWELKPNDWMDASAWDFAPDQDTLPTWWTPDVAADTERIARARATAMILRDGEHRLIVDGCWIVGGCAVVRDVRAGRIVCVRGSAQITNVGGSAQITNVGGSAQITNVGGSAQITNVGGSAQITNVGGSAQIADVRGSAQITYVRDSAQITNVGGSAQITYVGGSAQLDDSARAHVTQSVGAG